MSEIRAPASTTTTPHPSLPRMLAPSSQLQGGMVFLREETASRVLGKVFPVVVFVESHGIRSQQGLTFCGLVLRVEIVLDGGHGRNAAATGLENGANKKIIV
jgi:hypothetical protein